MDDTTYEQTEASADLLDFPEAYLTPGMRLKLEVFESKILNISSAQQNVVCEVASVEPMRSDTAAKASTPALLSNGRRVIVPAFVEAGSKIEVKLEDESYVSRV
eukprot:c13282_g1_i2.p1 GENE.c13282_g1_i2~~c13282_g1_i2.p1  ORF type:complete len:104 (+),score=26.86 c13282_g1_i2:436-747(+)